MKAKQSMFFVYGLIDPETGELRYVGKTSIGMERIRQHQHVIATRRRVKTYKERWAASLILRGRPPSALILKECTSNDEANTEEIRLIAYFRSLDFPLTNVTDGGEGTPGYKMPKEVSEAQSARLRKEWAEASEEQRNEIIERTRKNLHNPVVRAKIKAALKGVKMTRTPKLLAEYAKRKGRPMRKTEKIKAYADRRRGVKRGPMTEEQKARRKGTGWDQARREKHLALMASKVVSEETRRKMSESHKGKRPTEETRRKMAAGQIGKPKLRRAIPWKELSDAERRAIGAAWKRESRARAKELAAGKQPITKEINVRVQE